MAATDGFYYIMDYNGNYYRTDSGNQLVVAKDELEAGVFSFADANKRVGGGIKSHFYFMTPVPMEDTEVTMQRTEPTGNIADVIISTVKEVIQESEQETQISVAKELVDEERPELIEKTISEYDLSAIDWKEYLLHFTYIVAGLKEYRESLIKAESDIDLKICDILHYVELCEMDDIEAVDLIELLRVCREKRRDIKDEIIKLDAFQRNIGTGMNVAKAKEAIKAISGLETRKYTPRRFSELFEGGIMQMPTSGRKPNEQQKKIMEEMIETTGKIKKSPEHHEEGTQMEYTCQETQMEYTRKETVFDGRNNNWMDFARQQAEFYRNADQYIINLKLDMEEIDNAISNLMQEIEDSNCNVTQGYKLFKRLKELRLERKQKEKELVCVYILTEHFDMSAMSEECEGNVSELEKYLGNKSDDSKEQEEKKQMLMMEDANSEDVRMVV